MVDSLKQHLKQLEDFERQRVFWLRISGFVAISILLVIIDWNFIHAYSLTWFFVTVGLLTSIVWWYWTMMFIRKLINHKTVEATIMSEMITEIRAVKEEVKNLDQKG